MNGINGSNGINGVNGGGPTTNGGINGAPPVNNAKVEEMSRMLQEMKLADNTKNEVLKLWL